MKDTHTHTHMRQLPYALGLRPPRYYNCMYDIHQCLSDPYTQEPCSAPYIIHMLVWCTCILCFDFAMYFYSTVCLHNCITQIVMHMISLVPGIHGRRKEHLVLAICTCVKIFHRNLGNRVILVFFCVWITYNRAILVFFCVMATRSDSDDESHQL